MDKDNKVWFDMLKEVLEYTESTLKGYYTSDVDDATKKYNVNCDDVIADKYDEALDYKKAFLRAYYEISRLRRIELDFGSETESTHYKDIRRNFERELRLKGEEYSKHITNAESDEGFERATKKLDEM